MVVVWGLFLACWLSILCFSLWHGCVTRRKLVHPNHPLQLMTRNLQKKSQFGCQLKVLGHEYGRINNQNLWWATKMFYWCNFSPWVAINKLQQRVAMKSFLQVYDMLEDLHLPSKDQKWALCSLVYFILDMQC